MKRLFMTISMAVLLIAGGHCAFAAKGKNIKIDTIRFAKADTTANVEIFVHWPTKGDKAVVDSLQKFIGSLVDCNFSDAKSIKDYGESLWQSLSDDWHSTFDEMPPDERLGALERTHSIIKLYETKRYVTYHYTTFEYGGGMHGYTTEVGFTFRKSDGKQIKLLQDTDSPEFAQLIKEGIKSFFAGGPDKTMTDEEVLEFLFAEDTDDLANIPLPLNAPYLSDTGVVFLYTQYEIAPYSSGIITFEVPFAKIIPYLTQEAKALIK